MRKLLNLSNFCYFLLIIAMVFILVLFLKEPLNNLEISLYDFRARLAVDDGFFAQGNNFLGTKFEKASKDIIIVSIDDYSMQKLQKYPALGIGRLPWQRKVWGDVIDFINKGNPKAIVFDIRFEGAEGGLSENIKSDNYFAEKLEKINNVSLAIALSRQRREQKDIPKENLARFNSILNIKNLKNDDFDKLIIKSDNIDTVPINKKFNLKVDDSQLSNLSVKNKEARKLFDNITFYSYNPIFDSFLKNAEYIGAVNLKKSEGDLFRYYTPVFRLITKQGTVYVPSLPLAAALSVLPENEKTPVKLLNNRLIIGKRIIPIDEEGRYLINWHGKKHTYIYKSASKIILTNAYNQNKIRKIENKDKISPELFRNKIVIIGLTAAGSDIHPTAMDMHFPGPEVIATCIDNILNDTDTSNPKSRKIITKAPFGVNFIIILVFCLAVSVFNLRAKSNMAKSNIFVFLIYFLSITAALSSIILIFIYFRYWINMIYPILFITFTSFGTYLYKNYLAKKEKKEIGNLFGMFVSPQVLDKLLKNPKSINREGQRKIMTVLFSDIRGFTSISETVPAQELIIQLNEFFNEMFEIVLKYNGTMDKFIGDAIMAFYGDPLPMDDHAAKAVLTAIDMIKALDKLNEKWKKEGRSILNMGIGINTGEMVVGHLGAKKMVNYTVFGDSVNLASRLESLNKEYETQIIIGESTYNEVKNIVDAAFLGEVKIKGKHKPVKIYTVKIL
ncbi:MAG: adenylate/guanylate cyclase domain-containing protein [bacterium]